MATTTNFGWETPDDTDLVKDGAAAMRTLGNSIDTSFVDLKGGTSGQMLTKASNTDLDYTWVTPEIGDITAITASSPLTGGGTTGAVTVGILDGTTSNKGAVQLSTSTSSTSTSLAATASAVKSAYDLADGAIPKSLIDAAGDLIVGTAADTAGRLAKGTAGQVLQVNSGATALEWATPSSGGGMTSIASGTLASAIEGASITSISGSYTHLQLFVYGYQFSQDGYLQFRFNSDSGSNYSSSHQDWNGSAATDDYNVSATTGAYANYNSPTNLNSAGYVTKIDIYNYASTAMNKQFWITCSDRTNSDSASVNRLILGRYTSNSAITSIQIRTEGSPTTFAAGSYVLYGVK
jgi:hypothetical protein